MCMVVECRCECELAWNTDGNEMQMRMWISMECRWEWDADECGLAWNANGNGMWMGMECR